MNSLFAFFFLLFFVISVYYVWSVRNMVQKKESFTFKSFPAGYQMINTGVPLTESYSPTVYEQCAGL